jgi:hypothetical protein
MKLMSDLLGFECPRLKAVYKFTEHKGGENFSTFVPGQLGVAKQNSTVLGECLIGDAQSPGHFHSSHNSVMQDATKM